MNANEFNAKLCEKIARIANEDPTVNKHPDFIFHPLPYDSRKTPDEVAGLNLEWDRENGLARFEPEEQERIIKQMNEAAKRATIIALKQNRRDLGQVILDEAYEGGDYFDVFKEGPDIDWL